MCGKNVMMSVNNTPTPGGAPGTEGLVPFTQYNVAITETIAVRIARISAPHQGTSLAGGGGATVGGADTVGGGAILFLYDT